MNEIKHCIKRDGSLDVFDKKVITDAIMKAFLTANEGNKELAKKITESVVESLKRAYYRDSPHVEHIQDIVEDTLITYNFKNSAKAYITYRYERNKQRNFV